MSEERAPSEERLVSIFGVPDEASATVLLDFLKGQGIESTLVSAQIPWFGTIEAARKGYWGRIAVLEGDAARALSLIEDFYAGRPEIEADASSDEPREGE